MSGAPVDVFHRITVGGEPLAELAVPMRVVAHAYRSPRESLADSAPRSSTLRKSVWLVAAVRLV